MGRQAGWRHVHGLWATTVQKVRLCIDVLSILPTVVTGYGALIRTYVAFILAKLRFHRHRPEFNGLFEYEEYVSLKGIDDPNEGFVMCSPCRTAMQTSL
jgi:ANTH domain